MNIKYLTRNSIRTGLLISVFSGLLMFAHMGVAKMAMPDHVFYGLATWFGDPVVEGTQITFVLDGQSATNATYSMGMDTGLGGLYALRVPMDAEDPRLAGRARPGETGGIFINGNLVAQVTVGDYGQATRLDIDPANLMGDVPAISIGSAQVLEGQSGTTTLSFPVNLNIAGTEEITAYWQTVAVTAANAATGDVQCGAEVDYLQDSGQISFAPGVLSTSIDITVCGDTIVEENEIIRVQLSQPSNAIIQFDVADGTLINDDGQPELRIYDQVVYEPASGNLVSNFQVSLSRSYTQNVSFSYSTQDVSALNGSDYQSASASLTIPAGNTSANIPVTFFSDGVTESPEVMQVNISAVSNAIINDATGVAIILDAGRKPEADLQQENQNGENSITGLAAPAALAMSPDGQHLYVTTLISESISWFDFDGAGTLTFAGSVDISSAGFEQSKWVGLWSIVISPDGLHVYTAAEGDDAISHYQRNPADGALTWVANLSNESTDMGLDGVYDLKLSSDGLHLYAAGKRSNAIAHFAVNASDGSLAYQSHISNGTSGNNFMLGPVRMSLSPLDDQLYVASDFGGAIQVFDRNSSTGSLSYQTSYKNEVGGITGMEAPSSIQVSSDGAQVYVTARADSSVLIFNRNGNGSLSYQQTLDANNGGFAALQGTADLALSPQGDRVFALGQDDSSMAIFNREKNAQQASFGDLEFLDIKLDDSNGVSELGGPVDLIFSPDGKWVFVAASRDNTVSVFKNNVLFPLFIDGFED